MRDRYSTFCLAGLAAVSIVASVDRVGAESPVEGQVYRYHHPEILGTAMDLTVVSTSRADADAVDQAVIAEIARLQKILSAYDPGSELSTFNASPVNGPGIAVSPELIDVLRQYDVLSARSEGAYTGHAGDLIELWKQGEKSGQLPTDADLLAAAKRCSSPAWEIDKAGKIIRRISNQQINVDSLGKGYVIDRAVAAATNGPVKIKGLLLNIGGDLRTWGSPAGPAGTLWSVGIQDPAHPELNAAPLTTIYVPGNRSVSTSGEYQRYYTIGGKKYSHILDARTGQPGRNPAATVVASDSATANALATICCSMKFTEASALVRGTPGAESFIITSDGTPVRTDGFKQLQNASSPAADPGAKTRSAFPAGYKLLVDLQTVQTQHRPYVFVWITDSGGKHVKTLGAFGNDPRYLHDMHEWWKFARDDRTLQSITHATQRGGQYLLSWDGTDQKGNGVSLGKYTLWVEVSAEHGPYSAKYSALQLGGDPVEAKITASSAFSDVKINYGPGDKK